MCFIVHTYSLAGNSIGDEGAQAMGEGLQHCTNLQELKLVICVLTCIAYSFCTYVNVCIECMGLALDTCIEKPSIHLLESCAQRNVASIMGEAPPHLVWYM